jgi:predicted TIM-barrel fold metal-dependent hydrolase
VTKVDELGIKVIDVDTHVVEHYDLWTSRVSVQKYGDRVPHVVTDDDGSEWWQAGDVRFQAAASTAAAGWSDYPPRFATRLEDVDRRIWDPAGRLELMDEYGVHAAVLYPNVSGFGAGNFTKLGDMQLALLLLQAYNDYLAGWREISDRYIPVMAVPFWDLEASIAEMERAAAIGHKGMIFSQAPETFGAPNLTDRHWDPLWAAAQDMELSLNFHIAGGADMSGMSLLVPEAGAQANFASFPVTFFVGNVRTIAQLIGGGICHRFPRLKFVSVESGVSWLPFALDALDWMWKECGVAQEHPEYDLLPTEYFRRQIYGCFWFEDARSIQFAAEKLGPERILYETDFPHPTSMSPGPKSTALPAREFIETRLEGLSDELLRSILHDNAASLYHLDY